MPDDPPSRVVPQLHNETVNVWTHLLGCAGFVAMLFYVADGQGWG